MVAKKQHKFWTLKKKIFTLGAASVLILGIVTMVGAKIATDEQELRTLRKQQNLQRDVLRVKNYVMARNPKLWDNLATEIATAIVNASHNYRVPLEVAVGIAEVESEFNVFSVSSVGAKGLFQIHHKAWSQEIQGRNLFDPEFNANMAMWILNQNRHRSNMKAALTKYNIGAGSYAKGLRNASYVKSVFSCAGQFRYHDI